MAEKQSRQDQIKSIIRNGRISSQEELLEQLRAKGYNLTQATLSRDLRQIRVVKVHDAVRGYRYSLPSQVASVAPAAAPSRRSDFSQGVHSLAFNGSIMIVKTQPGFAGVVASMMDASLSDCVMGTVAGDDTIIAVLGAGCTHSQAVSSLSGIIPGIENKLI